MNTTATVTQINTNSITLAHPAGHELVWRDAPRNLNEGDTVVMAYEITAYGSFDGRTQHLINVLATN